jgi:hypothetical protein
VYVTKIKNKTKDTQMLRDKNMFMLKRQKKE